MVFLHFHLMVNAVNGFQLCVIRIRGRFKATKSQQGMRLVPEYFGRLNRALRLSFSFLCIPTNILCV